MLIQFGWFHDTFSSMETLNHTPSHYWWAWTLGLIYQYFFHRTRNRFRNVAFLLRVW
jgi:hypothetical protein